MMNFASISDVRSFLFKIFPYKVEVNASIENIEALFGKLSKHRLTLTDEPSADFFWMHPKWSYFNNIIIFASEEDAVLCKLSFG